MKTLEQFYCEITESKELREKLEQASAEHKLDEFLKENGISCTKEQFGEFALTKAKESGLLTDEELKKIAGGRDGEENDSKPRDSSSSKEIKWDEKGRPIQWQCGSEIYHYECYKCGKWLYKDTIRWYCPQCGEGFYWNVEAYRKSNVK